MLKKVLKDKEDEISKSKMQLCRAKEDAIKKYRNSDSLIYELGGSFTEGFDDYLCQVKASFSNLDLSHISINAQGQTSAHPVDPVMNCLQTKLLQTFKATKRLPLMTIRPSLPRMRLISIFYFKSLREQYLSLPLPIVFLVSLDFNVCSSWAFIYCFYNLLLMFCLYI